MNTITPAATPDPARDPSRSDPLDLLAIDTLRTLAMDAVQKANSGHPGTPMALAPVAYTLWQQFLRYDPASLTGRTATASSCRSAMRPCSCTACCIWPAWSR